jgi:hypothetical protein
VGLFFVMFVSPVLIVAFVLVLKGKEPPPPPEDPVTQEVDEYARFEKLRDGAQEHVRQFYRAKRNDDKTRIQEEFQLAKGKLTEAMSILEGLKVRYTEDGTLDGEMKDGFGYIEQDLVDLSQTLHDIIKENEY